MAGSAPLNWSAHLPIQLSISLVALSTSRWLGLLVPLVYSPSCEGRFAAACASVRRDFHSPSAPAAREEAGERQSGS